MNMWSRCWIWCAVARLLLTCYIIPSSVEHNHHWCLLCRWLWEGNRECSNGLGNTENWSCCKNIVHVARVLIVAKGSRFRKTTVALTGGKINMMEQRCSFVSCSSASYEQWNVSRQQVVGRTCRYQEETGSIFTPFKIVQQKEMGYGCSDS